MSGFREFSLQTHERTDEGEFQGPNPRKLGGPKIKKIRRKKMKISGEKFLN